MLALIAESRSQRRRRGLAGQRPRRTAEHIARRTAVACALWLQRRGHGEGDAAARLGVERTTLSAWVRHWRKDQLEVQPLGRAPAHATPEVRHGVLTLFTYLGPQMGLPTLRRAYPECPKAELVDLLQRCLARYRRYGLSVHALRWHGAGRVWAMDGTKAPRPIDGKYPVILAVRDLATGNILASVPAHGEDELSVASVLEALFLEYGPPLVLKSDNGACRSAEVEKLLLRYYVLHLISPPETPRYNGQIEAGFGGLKTEAHWEAARHDRPGQWTADDVEAARRKANETHRPWGFDQPTPAEAWERRRLIEPQERLRHYLAYRAYRKEEVNKRGVLPDVPLRRAENDAIERAALSNALIDCGYLTIRTRRIAPPLSRRFVGNISR